MKKQFLRVLTLLTCLYVSACQEKPKTEGPPTEIAVIPKPATLTKGQGQFELGKDTKLYAQSGNAEALRIAQLLADRFKMASGIALKVEETTETDAGDNSVLFTSKNADTTLGKEGYTLSVKPTRILVTASEPAGLFYGLQTLFQLLPTEIESDQPATSVAWVVPEAEVTDRPRFSWRGLHLDVGRHMMPVAFIKKYLDNMAMHKLNTFHWHLTEDQGWRIEIKKYPKLTEVGGWRKETLIGHYGEIPQRYDGKRYGGFYTQDEVKEVVKYAQDRFITVVPEIEMPGHSTAAVAAYPRLGVTGKQVEPVGLWGVFYDIYNVDDSTFLFLEDVLTEVMALFPSKYIHIGGDEAPKDQWKASPKIQAQMKALGIKDEHGLQSYFITRMEKFINSKGRQIIGWDEILEGGLAPNAAVMSWRGEAGGIAAAKSKHFVVMSPGSHLYFDHNQADPASEPLSIGGYTTLEKTYSYEPTPDTLTAEEAKYIMGAQANVWTEYLATPEQVEYMVFPRISSLAEVLWSKKEDRNWDDFKTRIPKQLQRYQYRGIHYAKSIYDVAFKQVFDSTANQLTVQLENQFKLPDMYYTTDGTEPSTSSTKYTQPLVIDKTTTIKAVVLKDGKPMGKVTERTYQLTKAYGKKATITDLATNQSNVAKDFILTNGLMGDNHFSDTNWKTFQGNKEITFNLGAPTEVSKINVSLLPYVSLTQTPAFSLEYQVSEDGKTFTKVADFSQAATAKTPAIQPIAKSFAPTKAQFVKIVTKITDASATKNAGKLMIDEISVE